MQLVKVTLSVVHLVALGFFALKYLRFDVKSTSPEASTGIRSSPEEGSILASVLNSIDAELSELGQVPEPTFDRFVLFILDAWRWNYLFNEQIVMPFVKKTIMDGDSIGFVSLARVPTVTKSCLKSLFSGTLPVFFEIVENIDESGMTGTISSSTATSTDNLLQRLAARGKNISVYGDDIWTKLFPIKMFHRHSVTFGFNILDYTEVDNDVHVAFLQEMALADAGSDVMILHYLGLDHIGHSFAGKEEFVIPKLKEMDHKIEDVYTRIAQRDSQDGKKTLMLVMGDHGMTSEGNHGGASKDETHAAAVFMSPHFKKAPSSFESWTEAIAAAEADSHNQEDLAATLTALLDGSNPLKFGSGCLIERVMKVQMIKDGKERSLLLSNLRHLLKQASMRHSAEASELLSKESLPLTGASIYSLSVELKRLLISDGFTFDEFKLKFAIGVLFSVVLIATSVWFQTLPINMESLGVLVSLITLAVCQVATSFIAEEHTIWQAAFTALILIWSLSCNEKSSALFVRVFRVLLLHRIMCSWNSVGTMWIHAGSIANFLKEHSSLEVLSVLLALLWILRIGFSRDRTDFKAKMVYICASLLVFMHRSRLFSSSIPSHLLAQAVLLILLSEIFFKNLDISAGILFVLVNKPSNSLLIAMLLALSREVQDLEVLLGGPACTFLYLCMIQCSYFTLGLWNSVSAVDLTFGAIFSKQFNMQVAPIVLLCYCWSGPILVALSLKRLRPGWFGDLMTIRVILDAFACNFSYLHRFHLWTFEFFSPKVMFQVIWAVFYSILLPLIFNLK